MMFGNQQIQQGNGLVQLLESPENLMDIYLCLDFGPNDFGGAASVPSSCYGEVEGGLCRDEEEDDVSSRMLEPPSATLVPSTSSSSMQKLLHVPFVKEESFKEEPLDQVIFKSF